ncbi:MAG: NAD(P)-binding domain-containing protein, partial [Pelagibacteraceae bacterium]
MKKIAFIGTGLMGLPMAINLLKKKYPLKAFTRTIVKAEPLKKLGGEVVSSLKDVVTDADVIITMLT